MPEPNSEYIIQSLKQRNNDLIKYNTLLNNYIDALKKQHLADIKRKNTSIKLLKCENKINNLFKKSYNNVSDDDDDSIITTSDSDHPLKLNLDE